MVNRIVNLAAQRGIIKHTDKEIYQYALQYLFLSLVSWASVILLGMAFGKVLGSLIFYISFIFIRHNAGGIHSKSKLGCFLFSSISFLFFLLINKFISLAYFSYWCPLLILLSGIIIFLFAPQPDEHRPITEKEALVYKKNARIVFFIEAAIILIITFVFKLADIAFFALCGLFFAAMLVLFKVVKNKVKI